MCTCVKGRSWRPLAGMGFRAFLFVPLLILGFSAALAGKPPAPPVPVDSGLIYYSYSGGVYSMAPDGTGKKLVLADMPWHTEPSLQLHGGSRWFLVFEPIVGETYPDGRQRFELFAVNEAREEVWISDDPAVQPLDPNLEVGATSMTDLWFASPRWAMEDTRVSYVGRRWGVDPITGEDVVTDGGIFAVTLPGDISQIQVLRSVPELLPIQVDFHGDEIDPYGIWPDLRGYDWSLDGASIVFASCTSLNVADASTGALSCVLLAGTECALSGPRWQPGGSTVAFTQAYIEPQGIHTILMDGTGRQTIASGDTFKRPGFPQGAVWSPAGTHLTYWRVYVSSDAFPRATVDVYRSTKDGGNATVLTKDIAGWPESLGWRPVQ